MQYPLGLTREYSHSRAYTELAPVASPAAGAGIVYPIEAGYWERLASLSFRLVTDGNAANRQVQLNVLDAEGVLLAASPAGGVQAASLTRDYSFLPGAFPAGAVVVSTFLAPLPDLFLQPGWSVTVTLSSVQAGDQVSRVRVIRERFQTGSAGYLQGPFDDDGNRLESVVTVANVIS